ncbi:MAG: 2-hydroxyacid dehydrogenase [Kiritimatiellae bacterium]|nr:2-hydroxyacid dehydrogenase [Kiritimatiellia bacterium]
MKIVVLEKISTTPAQRRRLETLGTIEWYDASSEPEARKRIAGADVVVVDWIDPSPFILEMKSPSLLALMSTGYDWIQHRDEARRKNVLVSNIPGYATEAVAEHLIGLLLAVARQIVVGSLLIRNGQKKKGSLQGFELSGKTIGVIGLGRIGMRIAKLAHGFGMRVITFNRHERNETDIQNVTLDELLSSSDVVCVCCPASVETKDMLDAAKLQSIRQGAVLLGATWGVVSIPAVIPLLKSGQVSGFAFDVAVEGAEIDLPVDFRTLDNVVLTPHVAFNTRESSIRQTEICIDNIAAYKEFSPRNVVN